MSELKNALRSGDVWVLGSRQFKDFDEYLVPMEKFATLKLSSELPLAVATDCDKYLHDRLLLLEQQLATVNRLAASNDLPDAIITESGLKVTPLDAAVPDTAQALIDQAAALVPHFKITELHPASANQAYANTSKPASNAAHYAARPSSPLLAEPCTPTPNCSPNLAHHSSSTARPISSKPS